MANEREVLVETEYEAVRREIADQLGAIRALEAGALGGAGAVLAWLSANSGVPRLAWLTPVALVIGAGARAQALNRSVELLGEFLKERERVLAGDANAGPRWETWRASRSAGLVRAAKWYWGVLLVVSIAAATWGVSREQAKDATSLRLTCTPSTASERPGISLECIPEAR
jgi:hypothetical protein